VGCRRLTEGPFSDPLPRAPVLPPGTDMHGPVLAAELVAKRPELRVLFVSGYSAAMPATAMATGRATFLPKPFPPSRLVAAVAELLAASPI
jgi:two-component system, cell cycle sensor histidine kinase and response regulator CckA